ncbi:hypothetical protein AXG93_2278s1490 [Marchantia polymorpha subsp. ruderalis]|uniref:Apoptosis inhibitor 5 n=1 Tax=Marchantia polymorpha subsp. ruderalis TaxID=1480154 RepID=A0A176WG66_MARPO|nr:hypothetical protein AXG93_2278s1490 [Marchantia polymorpha subsp. ruderalis]
MAAPESEEFILEKLYEYGERLSESKDKTQNESDYMGIIAVAKGSSKAKQLSAQLIPRYFKFFPNYSSQAINAQLDLCEEDELGIRVQAIRGLPLLCKDTPVHLPKIADVLGQLLLAEEGLERDAVQKALMSVLRQDTKASLTALFKHIENSDENIRERVLIFVREKVFPLKNELLHPQEEMERHITDLIKKSLQDVTGAEFKMFMDFLKSLSLFGDKAPPERVQELLEIVEGQADLDAQFTITDTDHIDRLMSCLNMALPFYARGASNSKFFNYINKHLLPVFDKLPEERKVDLLKNLAESSPFTSAQDARSLLPSIVTLIKKYVPRKKTSEELNFTYVECLLLTLVEEQAKATNKRLAQGMTEHHKAMAAAKDDAAKADVKVKKQTTSSGLQTCNNILTLTQPLHSKAPTFFGEKKSFSLSWAKPVATQQLNATGSKRTASAANGAGAASGGGKRAKGGDTSSQNQLVNRALASLSRGGRATQVRGGGRSGWRGGRSRGRHW